MAVKAKLKVILHADNVLVAESEDPVLWQRVFSAISSGNTSLSDIGEDSGGSDEVNNQDDSGQNVAGKGIKSFAKEIGISRDEAEGAFGPSSEAPFIHLDPHLWESLKKNTPQRGPSSVAPIALAGTILSLWFRHAGIEGAPTIKQCQEVLKTIDLRDQNANRSLRNTEWLQTRGNGIVINPARRSRAINLALAYCNETPVDDKS